MGAKKLKGARLILPLLCIVLIHAMGRGMRHWLRILKFCSGVVGENVKITFGPFNGFSGVIEEVNAEKKKLKVMVKVFGRKTPLELNYMQVEKE